MTYFEKIKRWRVSRRLKEVLYWSKYNLKPESFRLLSPVLRTYHLERGSDMRAGHKSLRWNLTCGPVYLLKHLSWSLTSPSETQPSFIFRLPLGASGERRDTAKSAVLMIDSERTEHPALSGHFARSCAAFSAVNVCDPTILSNSHTVLLAPEGVGGLEGGVTANFQ